MNDGNMTIMAWTGNGEQNMFICVPLTLLINYRLCDADITFLNMDKVINFYLN